MATTATVDATHTLVATATVNATDTVDATDALVQTGAATATVDAWLQWITLADDGLATAIMRALQQL